MSERRDAIMDDEKLISLVSNYPELYDLENENYMNHVRKVNIWNEISTLMGVTDIVCKEKWKALRDAYHRSLKRRQSKSGDGAKKIKMWRYEKQMEFLRPHFQERTSKTNIDNTIVSDDDDFDIATSPSSPSVHLPRPNSKTTSIPDLKTPGPSSRETSTPEIETPKPSSKNSIFTNMTARKKKQIPQSQVANVLQKYLDSRSTSSSVESTNPIHSFFKAMADAVVNFSPDLQLKVKNQVYSIVSQAEAENLIPTTSASELRMTNNETQFIEEGSEILVSTAVSEQPTTDNVTEYIQQPSQSTLQPESQLRYRYFLNSDGTITYKCNENSDYKI